MRNIKFAGSAVFAAAIIGFAGHALAAPITVDPWHSAGNGTPTGTNFGTVPNMDLLYSGKDAPGDNPDTAQMVVYAIWGTLTHVSYTDRNWASIGLRPDTGWLGGVSLFSFELGSYLGNSVHSDVRVYNYDYSQLLFQQSLTFGATSVVFTTNLFSENGLHIEFSNEDRLNYPIAIDNIVVEAGDTVPHATAPEPGGLAILGVALAAIAATRRGRSLAG